MPPLFEPGWFYGWILTSTKLAEWYRANGWLIPPNTRRGIHYFIRITDTSNTRGNDWGPPQCFKIARHTLVPDLCQSTPGHDTRGSDVTPSDSGDDLPRHRSKRATRGCDIPPLPRQRQLHEETQHSTWKGEPVLSEEPSGESESSSDEERASDVELLSEGGQDTPNSGDPSESSEEETGGELCDVSGDGENGSSSDRSDDSDGVTTA